MYDIFQPIVHHIFWRVPESEKVLNIRFRILYNFVFHKLHTYLFFYAILLQKYYITLPFLHGVLTKTLSQFVVMLKFKQHFHDPGGPHFCSTDVRRCVDVHYTRKPFLIIPPRRHMLEIKCKHIQLLK